MEAGDTAGAGATTVVGATAAAITEGDGGIPAMAMEPAWRERLSVGQLLAQPSQIHANATSITRDMTHMETSLATPQALALATEEADHDKILYSDCKNVCRSCNQRIGYDYRCGGKRT